MDEKATLFNGYKKYYKEGMNLIKINDFVGARKKFVKASDYLLQLAAVSDSETAARYNYIADFIYSFSNSVKEIKKPSMDKEQLFKQVTNSSVTLEDVVGLEDVKREIDRLIVQPQKFSELYKKFNRKPKGGILLYGVPGTGKTMIAKAIANEINAPFYSIKCSEIASKWFGESEQKVQSLFEQIAENPCTILFFDEFDALGCSRDVDCNATNRIVSELLVQIQGVEESANTVIVMAATNRPWDIDSAFLRSGRFSKSIYVDLPDCEARREIVVKNLKNVPVADDFDYDMVAKLTEGFNSADVVEFCEALKDEAIGRSIMLNEESSIQTSDIDFVKDQIKSTVNPNDIKRMNEYGKNARSGVKREFVKPKEIVA